jgi:maltose alpha-D-glucosyltransferase / alpha-amylase
LVTKRNPRRVTDPETLARQRQRGQNAPRNSGVKATTVLGARPDWFERAVFYELLPRTFYDSNGDGIGDIPGIVEKLDYLNWLGVDCLWLLPFYPSPLRDGGYDVSDYRSVAAECGTVEDVGIMLEEAHRLGIRVIADLVINHTSDQHPWFQASRADPTGEYGDFYVWSDTPDRWKDVRVIFSDSEPSNWTFDEQRQQYYWHRFYDHQPDLNYDNEQVQFAMLDVARFWLDLGMDGFRLDAVPYLFQRDGYSGENLPETHGFLKRMRSEVDHSYRGRVLLAEANQWPADVVDYFGSGDECHMCFHFPLMPRMFMAIRREQRFPITEILAQTPAIPASCQWGIFLRNHDELTLEMVTEDERDYMYAEYARDPLMRKNLGIRRRLAPLVENDRRVAELLYSLLLSLPGAPILYYGDEILMGENIHLGDRDTVRTPMQWTPDLNGGFSRADFDKLVLPSSVDPVYGFQAVNVKAELLDPSSFLHWLQRMLRVRRQYPVFAQGDLEVLPANNPSILVYLRTSREGDHIEQSTVLCVLNLSRFAQSTELSLGHFEGLRPIEMLGRSEFPVISSGGYLITIGPRGFYWLELRAEQ